MSARECLMAACIIALAAACLFLLRAERDRHVAQAAYRQGQEVGYRLGQCWAVGILAKKESDNPALRDRVAADCAAFEAEHAPGTRKTISLEGGQ